MAVLMIGYDLNNEGQKYPKDSATLIAKIKEVCPVWWHHLDSTWLVDTELPAMAVAETLWSVMDENDELLVVPVDLEHGAWAGFSEKGKAWLQKRA